LRKARADDVEDASHTIRPKARWSATAEVDGINGRLARLTYANSHLAIERVEIFVDWHDAPHRDGEIAIRTAPRTERDVYVDMLGVHA